MDTEFDFDLVKDYAYHAILAFALFALISFILYLVNYLAKRLKRRLLNLKLKSLKLFKIEIINVGKQELIITRWRKEPFVLQKKLDDFYIVYELNASLNYP